jgi:hypothetical protein
MPQKFRNVCFTLNNYDQDDVDFLTTQNITSFIIFGFEKGEEGTEHLQGYMEFKNQKRMKEAKMGIPEMHIEERIGTAEEAINYCKKDDIWFEFGERKQQGKNKNVAIIMKALKEGSRLGDIAVEYPNEYIRHKKAFEEYSNEVIKDSKTNVFVMREGNIFDLCQNYHTLFVNSEDDLTQWDNEELICIDGPINNLYIEKWKRGLPVKVKYGYQWKTIAPANVLHINRFAKIAELEKLPQKFQGVILEDELLPLDWMEPDEDVYD